MSCNALFNWGTADLILSDVLQSSGLFRMVYESQEINERP